ncbi:MAG: hypothetical protein IPK59_09140 [Rhodospirillaceae bacterium]|nr:hypothetical protein [Rhodospirillaceae bacterium]
MTTAYDFDPYPIHPEPRLWSLYQVWRSKGATGLPTARDLDRVSLARWRSNLMLIRFNGAVTEYEIEWEGPGLQQYYGTPRAGGGVETLTASRERDLLIEQYGAVLTTRRPAYFDTAFTNSNGVFAHQTKLILPLSAEPDLVDRRQAHRGQIDGRQIHRVLVGLYFRGMNNVVDIVDRLNDLSDQFACPKDAPALIKRRQATVTARRDLLSAQLHGAEKRSSDLGQPHIAAKLRTTLFIVSDMLRLEARMIEAGPSWPWDETRDDLASLFDFGLCDVIRADLGQTHDAALLSEVLAALEAYRDALLALEK